MSPEQNQLIDQLGVLYEDAKDQLAQITPHWPGEDENKTKLYEFIRDMRNLAAGAIQSIDPKNKLAKAKGFLAQAMGELNVISESGKSTTDTEG